VAPLRTIIESGELEKAMGYKISWRQFSAGGDVIRALASGDMQLGKAGSSPIAAAAMGANHWQVIRFGIPPAALPEILVGMRIAIGFGWTNLVAARMVAASVGPGRMVLNASNFLRTDIVVWASSPSAASPMRSTC
jgi:hypothetical protein